MRVPVLLVDDSAEDLQAMQNMLASPEYELVAVRSGADALRALLRQPFAAILLDVKMPEMDGFEVARLLREREQTRNVPILFLTRKTSDIALIYRGYVTGAIDYLIKPLDAHIVRAKVAVFANLYRQSQALRRQAEQLQESERKEMEAQLSELRLASARHFQNLAEALPQIVWTARPDGAIDYFNRRWFALTGLRLEQAKEWGWLAAIHPDERSRFHLEWEHARRRGHRYEAEIRLRAADGSYRWHLGRAEPERGMGGEIIAWQGTFTDIEEQRQTQADLAKAIRARDDFLSIASHELKTPINTLQLQIELLLRQITKLEETTATPRPLAPRAEAALKQVRRLTQLVNELLDVTRISAGRFEVERERVDLAAIVRGVVDQFEGELEKSGCVLSLDAPRPVVGEWDGPRIEQVAMNLITNAMKYGHGKPIAIRVWMEDERAVLTVEDHGIGIAPEDRERIFQRFERTTDAKAFSGLGLGLYIVRQIVEAHGGSIRVESQLGSGSTFLVELPLSPL